MKKLLTFIFVFSLTLGYSQEEILEWSIGTPVVTCGSDPSTDPTVICYPLQVSISNAANSPALGTTTMRFFYDTNYMNTLDIQNVQNGYTASGLSDNNSPVLGGPLGFSTDNAGVVDFNILDNAAANPINLSTTPVTVLDLCFTITTTGDALGLANNALCTPITFSNDHTTPSGATEDEGYGPNEGVVGFYYLNGNTGAPIAADDEALYYGWIPDPAFDGTLDSLADNIGATDTNNCTPYLCGVEFIQTVSGPWDIATNWIDGIVPTINDNAIIDAGVASYLTQDQAVNNLELRPGSTVSIPNSGIAGDPYILNIVGNIQNDGDFTLYNANQSGTPGAPTGTNGNPNVDGEVLLNGPATQTLSGTGNYYNLRVNNPNGVDVLNTVITDPTEINGILFVDNGDFSTNNNVLFPCFFEEPLTGDFQNGRAGQIGPVAGTISGQVRVEQCYPGRRAYRIVSASTTSAASVHNSWQEGATAWNNIPVPSTTQVDLSAIINGISYGYGTHITGLGELPTSGHTITPAGGDQFQGLDWQPSGNASMFQFNETGANAQTFTPFLNTAANTLTAGDPYLMIIRGSREVNLQSNASPTSNTKLRSTGTPEVGVYSASSGVIADEFVLLGNPYHSIVDMTLVAKTGLTDFIYVFDPTAGGNNNDQNSSSTLEGNRGAYVTIDLSSPATTGTQMNQFLQAYQGFFMQASQASPSITFNEANKAVRQQQLDVFSSPTDRIALTLYDQNAYSANGTADDRVVINFGQNQNNGVDYGDAAKFYNPDENLARIQGGNMMSVEYRAMPQIDEILELNTNNYRQTDYVFVAEVNGLSDNNVYLIDNYTGTETVLNNDAFTAISFSVDPSNPASEAADRFELRFETSTLGTTDFDLQGISVYPNPASDILNINLGDNSGRFENIQLFDINGRLIANKNLSNNVLDVQLDVNSFSSGVYLLKVSSDSEEFTTKVIIE